MGDGSYLKLLSLRKSLETQKEKNLEAEQNIAELRRTAHGIIADDRELEKAARNQLGLARPGERVFIFEEPAKTK